MDCSLLGSSVHGVYPGKNTGVGCYALLQEISTQRSKPCLLHRRRILYQLNHQGSPSVLEWVPYPFSRGASWLSNQTGASNIAGTFCTSWATREALWLLDVIRLKTGITYGYCWWWLLTTSNRDGDPWY